MSRGKTFPNWSLEPHRKYKKEFPPTHPGPGTKKSPNLITSSSYISFDEKVSGLQDLNTEIPL